MKDKGMTHISQASKVLCTTEENLIRFIEGKKGIEAKLESGQYYIESGEMERLKRNKKLSIGYGIRIPDGFITISEAHKKYNLNRATLINYMKDKNTIKIGRIIVCDESEIIEYITQRLTQKKEIKEFKEDKKDKWINMKKISGLAREKLANLIRSNMASESEVKIIYEGKRRFVFIEKGFLDLIRSGEIEINHLEYRKKRRQDRYGIDAIVKDIYDLHEVEKIISYHLAKDVPVDNEKKYTLTEVKNIIGVDVTEKVSALQLDELNGHIEIISDDIEKCIIFGSGIKKYLNLNGYISIQEISCIIDQPQVTIDNPIVRVLKKNDLVPIYYNNCIYVKKHIALEGLRNYLKNKALWLDNLEEILTLRVRLIDTPFGGTLNLVKKYLKKEVERLKSSTVERETAEFGRSVNGLDLLLNRIYKEIYMYENHEIENLLLELAVDGIKNKKITTFINYVRKELGGKCNYTKQVGESLISQLIDPHSGGEDKIYSKEIWFKYYEYLKDIDYHIIKAFEDERYAQIWLYCLLHLSITWRSKDIINKIPNISLEVANIYDFQWFKAGNNFTLSLAFKILEQVRFTLDGIIAYKNKMNLHLNVPISLKIPTAIVLIINEIHRRKNKQDCIFFKLKNLPPNKNRDYERFFSKEPYLDDFSNIKACRTLMTYNFSTAVSTVGMAGVAYQLNVYGRSHKEDGNKITNTTGMYLHLKNVDGDPADIAYQTIERGGMGFLYIKILECCLLKEEFSMLTQEELTGIIKDMRQEVSPLALENLSTNLLNRSENINIGLDVISHLQGIKTMNADAAGGLSMEFEKYILKKYVEIVHELFPEQQEGLEKLIIQKYKEVKETVSEYVGTSKNALRILIDILDGARGGLTNYSDCLFNELERKEKCPYKKTETCIGCRFNLSTMSQLYEVSNRLNEILDEMLEDDSLTEVELIKDTSIVYSYLHILIQAKAQYEKLDQDILSVFFNQKSVKLKINELYRQGKITYSTKKTK
jgi:predicted DNA-binding transcriptional regulator AlpA